MNMSPRIPSRQSLLLAGVGATLMAALILPGCQTSRPPRFSYDGCGSACAGQLQRIELPALDDSSCNDATGLTSGPPLTISNFYQSEFYDLTIDEAVRMALQNGKVLQRLGGAVVVAPQGVQTSLDSAIFESNPLSGPEAALSAFDAQVATALNIAHSERKFNNIFFGGGTPQLNTNSAAFSAEVAKQTALGTRFAVRNLTDYNRNNSPVNRFASTWDTVNQFEVRQPLARGAGAMVNRIAGPSGQAGVYNGVMIARIRGDISLADFEAGVRDLIRDVERSYWELFFAYRDLDTKIAARDSARETWENRQIRFEKGVGRPDEEAQARQQYYNFENQVQNALTGITNGTPGLLGAERNLRRLTGLPVNDGRILRPITEPAVAPTVFDWQALQDSSLEKRVELRRQKWTIKQRELELLAARQLNKWQVDLVGQYGFRGFGDDLFGNRGVPEGSAVADLWTGALDDYSVGMQIGGPVGRRQAHLAIRNAELQLCREKTILREQQRQILHDLGAAYAEVDRALAAIKTGYNIQVAAQEELEPKKLRVQEGKDQVFFLLDAQQRYANAESGFYRAVVDYNQALLNLAWTSGQLLDRYQIQLEESEWNPDLVGIAAANSGKLQSMGGSATSCPAPVSAGPIPQPLDGIDFGSGE